MLCSLVARRAQSIGLSGDIPEPISLVNSAQAIGGSNLAAVVATLGYLYWIPRLSQGFRKMTIELHTWNTPNGRKISVALEEMGLPYKVIPVNISKGEQMAPSFLAISPNNKIPAIVDPDGPDGKRVSIFESGAILLYLGE